MGKVYSETRRKKEKKFTAIEWNYNGEEAIYLAPKEILTFSDTYYQDYIKDYDDEIKKIIVTCIVQNVPIKNDHYITEELERYTKVFEFDWK